MNGMIRLILCYQVHHLLKVMARLSLLRGEQGGFFASYDKKNIMNQPAS